MLYYKQKEAFMQQQVKPEHGKLLKQLEVMETIELMVMEQHLATLLNMSIQTLQLINMNTH